MSITQGKVYLVGAGPGDPGLITVRGRECIEHADVIFYDSLANPVLLELAPNAEHVFAGKATDRHTLTQEEINGLIVAHAQQGRRVVRLKGGDPFVFGRGGEEALVLAGLGIPFEIVPGVTAGIAAPAFAGIPVTHRGASTSVTLITGHDAEAIESGEIDLGKIPLQGTLVFYMSVRNLSVIVRQLVQLGRSPQTPAAVIASGTHAKQRTVVGTLTDIAELSEDAGILPPAIAVIGEVVSLHEKLSWFENLPLFGKRVVVTRARNQASELVRQLHELGADVFEFPTIEIEPAKVNEPFDYVGNYDWLVLTSVNGVEMLFERMDELGQDARDLAGVKLCVIGSATADAVRKRFLKVDFMPERYVAEDLMAALLQRESTLAGKRFLLPRADLARSFLPEELRKHGAEATELVAYRTVTPRSSNNRADALLAYRPDIVTFTSSSTARNFYDMIGPERVERIKLTAVFASIGPITANTANDLGMPVTIQPDTHDIPHLVESIVRAAGRS
ncbi:MAG: uroporphyrinogen-III C-methyltransferase [Candidatus Hydrogenedentes bacterium]|nr:uroporphyrinogen-III C-methyltransferase [Candidatus Hydrogenedentota bacterium]